MCQIWLRSDGRVEGGGGGGGRQRDKGKLQLYIVDDMICFQCIVVLKCYFILLSVLSFIFVLLIRNVALLCTRAIAVCALGELFAVAAMSW